ncbi:LysR family transcriptional regulator [Galbitalea sp. SE-J8]|uniref:LysR family transcriptional regulator n=1 Tax=Galbitalea sp. SE-J8 TaxID=3054952 RepID=UPI00259CC6FC|nr:LysR family transcriptional regulator [Galbitalea sp. SE-J8]MDM4762325.1 LysR family transcriptional regulator [Galbitalea sp. SE-J8]
MPSTGSLEHLRTFLTVHRAGSLTEAAGLLGLSQPTVSAHIRSLEAALGYRLFVRGRTGVTTTAKGSELARELGPHIDALDDLTALAATAVPSPRAVHLGGPADLIASAVLPHLAALGAAVAAPVWFRFGLADELLEALRTRELDVVVSAVPPRAAGVAATPLYDEEFVLVAAPHWADAVANPERIPVIAYAGNLPIVRRYWRSVFGRRPDALQLSAVVPDLRGIRVALLGGAGMSVLPHYLVEADLARGDLVALHRPEVAPLNTVFLATRAGETPSAPARALVAELRRLVR